LCRQVSAQNPLAANEKRAQLTRLCFFAALPVIDAARVMGGWAAIGEGGISEITPTSQSKSYLCGLTGS
jgi:hypothetical protein